MKKSIIAVTLLFLVAACQPVQQESQEQLQEKAGPFPENYKQLVKDQLRVSLKDPDSVKDLVIPPPHAVKNFQGLMYGGGFEYLYATCISLNAKNSFGGYGGTEIYTVHIKNGMAYDMCKGCWENACPLVTR